MNATSWIAGDLVVIQDALAGDPGVWLPRCPSTCAGATATGPDGGWDVLLRVGTVSQPLRVTVGPARSAGPSQWRSLSWAPALHVDVRAAGSPASGASKTGGASLPAVRPPRLDALLGTVPLSAEPCPGGRVAGVSGVWLLLAGSYVPPLGVLDLPDDQAAVDELAEACATAFAAQIADCLRRLAQEAPSTPHRAPARACGSCRG